MTLQLYILRQLLVSVGIAVGGLVFIAVPGVAVNAVHKLGGVSMGALLGYLPLVLVDLVPYLLPIAFLLGIVVTYGRLAADNEWTAIVMAGIHPARMVLPGLLIAAGLGGLTYYLSTEVSPGLSFAKRLYLRDSVVRSFRNLNRGQTELSFGSFYLSAQFREKDGNTFRDVLIHLPSLKSDSAEEEEAGDDGQQAAADEARADGRARDDDEERRRKEPSRALIAPQSAPADGRSADRTVIADTAVITIDEETMQIVLHGARHVGGGRDLFSEHFTARVNLDRLFDVERDRRPQWKYVDSRELRRRLAHGKVKDHDIRKAWFEWHQRNTMAATYVMFLLLGVPTGLVLRRGTQLAALAIAVGYALAYYLLSMRLGKALGSVGTVPAGLAAWATTLIGLVSGAVMSWRAWRR